MMRLLLYAFLVNLFVYNAKAQLLFNNDPDFTVESGGLLHIEGSVEIGLSGFFHNSGEVYVEGDWENNTSIIGPNNGLAHSLNSGKVFLFGDAVQLISGSPTTFNDLVIKGNAYKVLDIATYVGGTNGTLTLENQGLHLNTHTLYITNPANAAINAFTGSPMSYIESEDQSINSGAIHWEIGSSIGAYTIPWARNSLQLETIPFVFDIQTPGDATGYGIFSTHRVNTDNTPYPQNDNVLNMDWNGVDNSQNAVDRFWRVNLDSYSTKPSAKMSFSWYHSFNQDETDNVPPASAAAQMWDGAEWVIPYEPTSNLVSTSETHQVTTDNPISVFNNWWVLSNTAQPLPIELIVFDGYKFEDKVKLIWSTSTEINNDYFIIERADDQLNFTLEIDRVEANGTSFNTLNYHTFDLSPLLGINYYRLKQYDLDGTYTLSNIISVYFESSGNYVHISPNPSSDQINITYNSNSKQTTNCEIYNNLGQLVRSSNFETTTGLNNQRLTVSDLSEGVYFINLQQGQLNRSFKFMVSR